MADDSRRTKTPASDSPAESANSETVVADTKDEVEMSMICSMESNC